jgi:hypothetical protein
LGKICFEYLGKFPSGGKTGMAITGCVQSPASPVISSRQDGFSKADGGICIVWILAQRRLALLNFGFQFVLVHFSIILFMN